MYETLVMLGAFLFLLSFFYGDYVAECGVFEGRARKRRKRRQEEIEEAFQNAVMREHRIMMATLEKISKRTRRNNREIHD